MDDLNWLVIFYERLNFSASQTNECEILVYFSNQGVYFFPSCISRMGGLITGFPVVPCVWSTLKRTTDSRAIFSIEIESSNKNEKRVSGILDLSDLFLVLTLAIDCNFESLT
jgi:hypothetical protein